MSKPPDDLLNIFWVEAAEYLAALNQILLQLEVAAPDDDMTGQLREVSRVAHSLKGAARAVGQSTIETLSHQMEEVFDLALAGAMTLSPAACDALYDSLDVIQMYADGKEADEETINLVLDQLTAITQVAPLNRPKASAPASDAPAEDVGGSNRQLVVVEPVHLPADDEPPAAPAPKSPPQTQTTTMPMTAVRAAEDTVRVSLSKLDQLMGQAGELLVARMHSEQRRQEVLAILQEHRRWQRIWRRARSAYIRTTRRVRDAREIPGASEGGADLMSLLDFLDTTQHYMSLMGRSLIALNRDLVNDNLHLTTLTDELQADIASVRMLPFETILGAFQRMVRDLARETGKEITLVIEGAEVELDKHVLELLKDPLIHLLRNAVDHGIEMPDVREAAQKSRTGTITLQVVSRGNDIHVKVDDDGGGINIEAVRRKAVASNVLGDAEVETLSEDEIAALIFQPGFSTAAKVTSVSGRGVGLDVVRQRIEALRGRLWLENAPGLGTTFNLIVPVSLTRIRCLLARIGDERYAIPLTTVTRIIDVDPQDVFHVEDRPMIEVDGRPMPLVHLAEVLERPGNSSALTANSPILVLHSTERTVAFIIDELVSEQELVLKKLGDELSRVRNVSGAAILGTGDVIVVLNTTDLIRSARRSRVIIADALPEEIGEPVLERPRWVLVVDDSLTTRTLERNILEAAGYRVRTATDGNEALRALIEQPPDVIVCDVEMPNMNGFELAKRVKSDARWRDIPFVLVTSLDSPSDREQGLRAGADAYLVKTRFDQDELLQVVEQMV